MDSDIEVALELVKEWLSNNKAALLAKEDLLVHWGTASAVLGAPKGWVSWSMKEAVQVLKATVMPFGLMKLCNADLVRAACTELDASYISGVHSAQPVSPQYFNFYVDAVSLHGIEYNVEADLISRFVHHFARLRVNVQLVTFGVMFEYAANLLGQPTITANARNLYLRQAIDGTEYEEKNYTRRYWFEGVSYSCIRLGKTLGIFNCTADQQHDICMDVLRDSAYARKFATGDLRKALNVGK